MRWSTPGNGDRPSARFTSGRRRQWRAAIVNSPSRTRWGRREAKTATGSTKLSTSGGAAGAEPVVSTTKVNWGQQEKHLPGHPNLQTGRSTLTADPVALAARAGTGEPVNKIPPGQAGYKERVDFGYLIGSYASEDGAAAPTTVGLFHYRADGSVHIVPGRPAP